jgi:hypothetical protein
VLPVKDRGENVPVDYKNDDEGMGHPEGIHSGSLNAALERGKETILPIHISGSVAAKARDVEDLASAYDPRLEVDPRFSGVHWSDAMANNSTFVNTAIKEGKNVAYRNDVEDVGSTSMRSPRRNVRTWSEQVIADPSNFSHAERSAVRKGAELVYKPVTYFREGSKPTGFPEGILHPPTLTGVSALGEHDVVPHMVYPHKKAKKKASGNKQLRLDI